MSKKSPSVRRYEKISQVRFHCSEARKDAKQNVDLFVQIMMHFISYYCYNLSCIISPLVRKICVYWVREFSRFVVSTQQLLTPAFTGSGYVECSEKNYVEACSQKLSESTEIRAKIRFSKVTMFEKFSDGNECNFRCQCGKRFGSRPNAASKTLWGSVKRNFVGYSSLFSSK